LELTRRFRERRQTSLGDGQLVPVLARTFPLEQAAETHRSMEAGGNVYKNVLATD